MKFVDTRDRTVLQGDYVTTLPAGVTVSQEDALKFYGIVPGSKNYAVLTAPMDKDRIVLRRGADTLDDEPSYYIVPCHLFYQEEE